MRIFKYIGYILLLIIIYNYLSLQLQHRGIKPQDLFQEIITFLSSSDLQNYYKFVIPLTSILIFMC